MMTAKFFTFLCALFLSLISSLPISWASASGNAAAGPAAGSPSYRYVKKWGNGFEQTVSVSAEAPAYLGGGHWVHSVPALRMNPSTNIFMEYMQRLFMPSLAPKGRFKTPLSPEEHLAAAIPICMEFPSIQEVDQFVHLYEPEAAVAKNKSVLIVPGSKKARLTELYRSQALAREGYRVAVMDYVAGSDASSTVSNQLSESLDANAINVLLAVQWMQEKYGAHDMAIQGNSVGSQHVQHAFDPELLAKVPTMTDIVPRIKLLQFNDFAGPLIPFDVTRSTLKAQDVVKHVGTKDYFTSLDHVQRSVAHYEIDQNVVKGRDGAHDLCCAEDLPHEGSPYFLANAKNYSALLASMPMMLEAVQGALSATIAEAPGENNAGVLLEILMQKLLAIPCDGNIFSNPKLYIHGASIGAMKARIEADRAVKAAYIALDRDEFKARFDQLFVEDLDSLALSQDLVLAIGTTPDETFAANQHILTDYALRQSWFVTMLPRAQLDLLHLPYKPDQTDNQLRKKVAELVDCADLEEQDRKWTSLFGGSYSAASPDQGVWIIPMQVMEVLSLLPMGAVFGPSGTEYEDHEETLMNGIRGALQ